MIYGHEKINRSIQSSWFNGSAYVLTYSLEELLGSKMRALYQRRKGSDLFDLWFALEHHQIDIDRLVNAYHMFMEYLPHPPSRKMYLANISEKMNDDEFLNDMKVLLKPEIEFNIQKAFKKVNENILQKI